MLILGLFLVLLAAAVLLVVLLGGANDPAPLELGIVRLDTTTMEVFLVGVATALVLAVGLVLLLGGLRRGSRRRREHKEVSRRAQELEQREQGRHDLEPQRGEAAEPSTPVTKQPTSHDRGDTVTETRTDTAPPGRDRDNPSS
jgi:membrane protein implicated in regulation of membrane protease activity